MAEEVGIRKKISGVFSRFGKKVNYKGYSEETVLVERIVDDVPNEIMCDHIWFSLTKGFENLKLTRGDVLQFDARIITKGTKTAHTKSTTRLKILNLVTRQIFH